MHCFEYLYDNGRKLLAHCSCTATVGIVLLFLSALCSLPGNAVKKLATCELCTDRYWYIVANGKEIIPGGARRRYKERKRWKQIMTQTEGRWSITDGNFMVRQSTGCWQTDDKFVWPLPKPLYSPNLTSHYNTGCSKITIMDITAGHLKYTYT